jgi:hypothetical protein
MVVMLIRELHLRVHVSGFFVSGLHQYHNTDRQSSMLSVGGAVTHARAECMGHSHLKCPL